MNEDNLDALFKALLLRKQNDGERLRLYRLRDALPPAMRDSPSVLAELILQFDHAQRMNMIAKNMETSAARIARRTMEETINECLDEASHTFSTAASVTIERLARKVEQATAKRIQSEGRGDSFVYTVTFFGGMMLSLFIIYVMNRFGLR